MEGVWEPGIVKSMLYNRGMRYVIDLFKQGKEVTVSPRALRPSEHLTQEVLNDMLDDMPDPSQEGTNPPDESENVLAQGSETVDIPKDIDIAVSQEPWRDGSDFVNPEPMQAPKPKRFKEKTASEIDKLQAASKSVNTHRQTQWGVKVFKGKYNSIGYSVKLVRRVIN